MEEIQRRLGGFAPDISGQGNLLLDTNLDGIGDGVALTTTLTEYSFPFTVDGTVMDFFLELESTASSEPIVIDNLQIFAVQTGVPGDYNEDGVVNAADYSSWLSALGSGTLPNESASPGVVDSADYDFWKTQFSATNGLANTTQFVPEPSALALLLVASILCCFSNRVHDTD